MLLRELTNGKWRNIEVTEQRLRILVYY